MKYYEIKRSTYHGWVSFPEAASKKLITENIASIRKDEVEAVLKHRDLYPDIGYRKFCWQMVDENVAHLSEWSEPLRLERIFIDLVQAVPQFFVA